MCAYERCTVRSFDVADGDRELVQGALDRIALIERDLDSGGWHRDQLRAAVEGGSDGR